MRVSAPGFLCLILHSYDYNILVEGLVPAKLCLVTLLHMELINKYGRANNFRLTKIYVAYTPGFCINSHKTRP